MSSKKRKKYDYYAKSTCPGASSQPIDPVKTFDRDSLLKTCRECMSQMFFTSNYHRYKCYQCEPSVKFTLKRRAEA